MSFITEHSVHCWKVSPRRRADPYLGWSSSSSPPPSFHPYSISGVPGDKRMQSGCSVVQRLTYLGTLQRYKFVLRTPSWVAPPVRSQRTQLRSIASASAQAADTEVGPVAKASPRAPSAQLRQIAASSAAAVGRTPLRPITSSSSAGVSGSQAKSIPPSSSVRNHVRPIATTSSQASTHDRSSKSKAAEMGDFTKPLKQIMPALQEVVPLLAADRHKGQAGRVAIIGGCREYTGAPYYAGFSALKMGADLSHVFCTAGAGTVIKSYSPELIVHPVLKESHDANPENLSWRKLIEKVVADVGKWIERFDCIVIGPGLGRDELLMESVSEIIMMARENNIPMVIDGDGLFLVTSLPELICCYPLAILTPNVAEHKRLVGKIMEGNKNIPEDPAEQLRALAERMGGVTIVQKGKSDLISDGQTVIASDYFGSPRRCGGQGDVLSGSTAVFFSWARQLMLNGDPTAITDVSERICGNPAMVGALAGSLLLRKAAADAFSKHRRSTLTTDIIDSLGPSMQELFPVQV